MAIPTTHHTVSEILYIFRENELLVGSYYSFWYFLRENETT